MFYWSKKNKNDTLTTRNWYKCHFLTQKDYELFVWVV